MSEQERTADTLVTSENMQDFALQRIAARNPAPSEPPKEAEAREEGPAEEEAPEGTDKPKSGIQERFSTLAAQRREAQERADAAEKRAAEAEERAKALTAKYEKPAERMNAEPDASTYTDIGKYKEDFGRWVRQQVADERREAEAKAQFERAAGDWTKRLTHFKDSTPDYDAVINSHNVSYHDAVRREIFESELGPELTYYLATHAKESEELRALPVEKQLKRLGKLEDKVAAEAAQRAQDAKDKKAAESVKDEPAKPAGSLGSISSAPPPLVPLKGAAAPQPPVTPGGEFKGSYDEYKNLRRQRKI